MTLYRNNKTSFLAGEVAPTIHAAVGTEKYQEGLIKCENYIVDFLGGIKNRPGTQYLGDAYGSEQKSRLVPFQFNEEQAYMLEFANHKMRIFKDGGLVGAPTVVDSPYSIEDVATLEHTQSADVLYAFHGERNIRKVTRTSDTAWTITEFPDMDGPYKPREIGDENVRIKVVNIASVTYELTADTAIFGDVEVGEPIRLGFPVPGDLAALEWKWFVVSTWTSTTVIRADMQVPRPLAYQQVVNPDFKNGTGFWEERSTGSSSLTYDFLNQSAVLTDAAGGSAIMQQAVLTVPNATQIIEATVDLVFGSGTKQVNMSVGTTPLASDLLGPVNITAAGVYVRSYLATQETVYISFDTAGSTDGDIVKISNVIQYDSGSGSEYTTTDWRLAAWNSTHGYPKYGIIDKQRLICANTKTQPQTVWASELGNFESFGETTPGRASDSFSFKPPTEEINGIKWVIEKDGLKVGTADAVWRVFAPSGGAISPTDINIEVDEAEGSLDLKPVVAHNAIIITPRGSSPVLEMVSSLEAKGFVTRDIGTIANHLFKNRRIVRWAFAKDPDSVIWCILDNGQLLGLTYHRRQDVWAWHRHTCSLGSGYADVAVIPNSSDDNIDDVYFLVNRGGEVRSVNLISCDATTRQIYIHDGITKDVISSFHSPGNDPTCLAFDGNNLVSTDTVLQAIYHHSGISSTLITGFASPGTAPSGVVVVGGNLISADINTNLIYIHNGITSSIASSFATPGTFITGLAFDGVNLISCDKTANLIYIHNGISAAISSSFATPGTDIRGITFDGVNLISSDEVTDLTYIHDGVTSAILSTFPNPDVQTHGLAYTSFTPDNPTKYYIERINKKITPQEAAYGLSSSGSPHDYKVLDSSLTYDDPKTITGATQANPVVLSLYGPTVHGYSDGDLVRIQNVKGMTELNDNVYKVANKTGFTFELNDEDDNNIDGTGFTAYITGGESRKMVTTVSGFGHLEGETITALADGAARTGLVVSSGDITLPQPASFVQGGVPYISEAETLDIETIFQAGSTQGRKKAISSVDVYFTESRDCKVYASNRTDKVRTVEFEDEAFGEQPPPLFDGIKSVDIRSEHGKRVSLVFRQESPYPSHIRKAIIDVDYAG